jgi:hypothetical protein
MLWFIQNIIFSVSLIVIIHYLYIYFETTLTAPKVKDLIHCPKQKYKSLFDTINKNLDNNLGIQRETYDTNEIVPTGGPGPGPGTGPGPGQTPGDMKTDLKTFLRGIGLKAKSGNDSFTPSYEMS